MRRAVIEREQTARHMAELETALGRARTAEKARSMFFSVVSHDIRTPLNAILGYSELLRGGIADPVERAFRKLADPSRSVSRSPAETDLLQFFFLRATLRVR